MTQSYGQILRNRRLVLLLVGDVMSKIGDGMVIVVLPILALRIHAHTSAALAAATVVAAPFVLSVPLSLLYGLGRYRFPPRKLLIADCAVRFCVFTGLAALAATNGLRLWPMVAVLLVGSALRNLAASARRLVATTMVSADGRFAVNGLLGTSDSLALYVIGPALGGVLAALSGPALPLLIDGISFLALLAIVVITAVPQVSPATASAQPASAGSASHARPASGWRILRRLPGAFAFFTVFAVFNLLYGPVEVALPLLVQDHLHANSAGLGVIWTSFGIGALVGAIGTNHLRRLPPDKLLVSIIAGWGLMMIALAASGQVLTAAIAFAVGGMIWAPFTPVAYTLLQSRLLENDQQPVVTLWSAGVTIAAPLGILIGGPLVRLAGSRGGLVASGATTVLLALAAVVALRRFVDPAPGDIPPDAVDLERSQRA